MSKCCKKYGPTSDNGMSTLLLNNIAARTKPSVTNCCTGKFVYSNCKCSGNAGSVSNNNIYRDQEIFQTLKSSCCGKKSATKAGTGNPPPINFQPVISEILRLLNIAQ